MTQRELNQKMKALDVAYKVLDDYFEPRYKKATTVERIKIRGIQRCISKIVELELLIEAECNK